ncbi:GH25 family lysozyme [Sphingosinithalassobacter portus]|uniref:GH25 family lysozyme n=1 Tax=Stakelama portus TaxID=2676234 RepID=UPI000D6EAD30|nr:GH25 family lysozyme [Sphingosinithalassobacter portus]
MVAPRIVARRLRVVSGIALALALIGLAAWLFLLNWRPAERAFPVQGVDVSAAQGRIQWFALKAAGARFAYARATMGAAVRDDRFAANWQGMYEAEIPRGAIHIYSLCQLASDQAANFVTTVPRRGAQLPAAIDLDFHRDCTARPDRQVVLTELQTLLRATESHLGKTPILRISKRFEDRYRISEAFPNRLWAVGTFFPPDYLARGWTLWQANRFRHAKGVTGALNWNVIAPAP